MKMSKKSKKISVLLIGVILVAVLVGIFIVPHQKKLSSDSVGDSPLKYGLPATSQEVLSKRTATSKTFKNANGTYTAVIAQAPIHYKDSQGNLQDVQLAFNKQRNNNQSTYIADKSPIHTTVTNKTLQTVNPTTGKGVAWIIPSQFTVQNDTATYTSHGLTWTYQLTSAGTKLSAKVDKSQGKKTYSFQYQLIGGAKNFTGDEKTGNLIGDGFIVPKVTVIGKDGKNYPVSGWQMTGKNQISFTLDDSRLPASAYPYVIDPTTTFDVAASGDDGDVYSASTSYPPPPGSGSPSTTATDNNVEQYIAGSTYVYVVSLVRWDTSSIPDDATVTSATFHFYATTVRNDNSRNFTAEWYDTSNWPIDNSDYSNTAPATPDGSVAISSLTNNAYNDMTLSNASSNVNLTGYTGIRLFIDGTQPSSTDAVNFSAYDNGSNIPELLVTYSDTVTWFDNDWLYRQGVTVTNSTGSSISNLQKLITVDTASLISAGKLQSDCDDLRFADSSGTALSYYIDSGCNSSSTKIWVKIPSLSTGDTTIYMYYGNDTATQGSDATDFDNLVNLVGYWTLNDGSGSTATDSSINGNDGTLTNSPTWSSSGEFSNAISFDGTNDYVVMPDNKPFSNDNINMTITAWFKTSSAGVIVSDIGGCTPAAGTCNSWDPLLYVESNGKLHGGGWIGSAPALETTSTVNDGSWHMATLVVSGTHNVQTLYLDGSLVGSVNGTMNGLGATSHWLIGTGMTSSWPNTNSSWYYFNGLIDDVKIYNGTRTGTQISTDYSTTYTIQTAGLGTSYSFLSEEENPDAPTPTPTVTPEPGHMQFNGVKMNGIRVN